MAIVSRAAITSRLIGRLRRHAPELGIAAAASFIAWLFVWRVTHLTSAMGLPLDDAYIYLTYAKQFARGQPFTYYPGGGYSAGSTSALWPMVLAPLWALGARGHAFVWASYTLCAALYAATAIGASRVARRVVGFEPAGTIAGVFAALLVLSISVFAWTALSGMEVAFASTLLIATILQLMRAAPTGPPTKVMVACLAATSLSRPEATVLVVLVVAVAVISRRRELRAAAWWCAPLVPPLVWITTNKIFAGHFFPNTGVVKSHFYLPGFTWSYWWGAFHTQLEAALDGLFFSGDGPLPLPYLFLGLWLAGAARVGVWAHRERKALAGTLIIAGPFVLIVSVLATSASPWDFQNDRYIAPALPLFAIVAGCALAPLRGMPPVGKALSYAAGALVVLAMGWCAIDPMRADILLYAQGVADTNAQVIAIGRHINAKLPDATIMFHDAGAIAYYGDGRVYDMLGLVTNNQAGVANNGPGARFEFLESLPPEQRPTHFAYYPSWMGTTEFFGEVEFATPLRGTLGTKPRLTGAADMQVIVANWDHVGTAERPLLPHDGWDMVDRLDVADMASEHAHGWHGELGERKFADPTARWSFVEREARGDGLVIDGGRTIRGGAESFTMTVDAARPVRLVLRTGGTRSIPYQETIVGRVAIVVYDGDREVGRTTILPPADAFAEIVFDIPRHGDTLDLRTEATAPYRAFHWFALQPR